jgi:hypothetical protein
VLVCSLVCCGQFDLVLRTLFIICIFSIHCIVVVIVYLLLFCCVFFFFFFCGISGVCFADYLP